jgi:mycothiol synthase
MPESAAMQIESFDSREATDAQLGAIFEVWSEWEGQDFPEDSPHVFEEVVAEYRYLPPYKKVNFWVARLEGRPAGYGLLKLRSVSANNEKAGFEVAVASDLRRRGIAAALLAPMVEAALAAGRGLMETSAYEGSDGAAFLEAVGAHKGLVERLSRLLVDEVDERLLQEWVERAGQRASDYRLEFWEGRCPPEWLARLGRIKDVMNTAPTGELVWENETTSPEHLEAKEKGWEEGGFEWWTLCAFHTKSGEIAGFTQLLFPPYRAGRTMQEDTAVDPAHRNRGLGRWMKAGMILRLRASKPGTRSIDTWNAEINDPMLSINRALGFKTIKEIGDWQIPAADLGWAVKARLGRRGAGVGD